MTGRGRRKGGGSEGPAPAGGDGPRAPGRRTLTDRMPPRPAAGSGRVYLRQLLRGKDRTPGDVGDDEIRTTAEYGSYMDHNLVWQWHLHVTEAEALAACRLVLSDLAAGRHVSWPGDARKYIYAVRAIDGMKAATVPEPSHQELACDMGPVCEADPEPPWPDPVPPPPEPEPRPPTPTPDPPPRPEQERRIVTPTLPSPKPEDKDSLRKRIDDAGRWLEDLRRRGDKLADELEPHVKQVNELFQAAGTVFAAGLFLVLLPTGEGVAYVAAELAAELNEIDRLRQTTQAKPEIIWEDLTEETFWKYRNEYVAEVRAIEPEAMDRVTNGEPLEQVARWAHGRRRELGVEYKNLMPPDLLEDVVYPRNRKLYGGDKLGPTFEFMMKKHDGRYLDIIKAAARPDGGDIIPELLRRIRERGGQGGAE